MMTMDSLSILTRGLMALWLLLLLYVGFFILFRYVQRHRWWVRYIPLLILMVLEYTLFQAVMHVTYVILALEEPGWIYSVFHSLSFLGVSFAELVMTAYIVYLWWRTWKWQNRHITGSSVKEGVDSLPTGLLYFWDDGRIKLVNRRMMEITRQLTGLSLQDGRRLMTRLWEGQEPDKDSILQLPDGSHWSFYHRELMMEGERLHELIAADVSEEYRLREELAEENRRLAAMNRRLQDLNDMIGEITVEKETLVAKIRIHDETGRTMLATRRFLESKDSGITREELFTMWERVAALPLNDEAGNHTEDITADLHEAADAIGLELTLTGEAKTRLEQRLLLAGARECLTNAYRHAGATRLLISIERPGEKAGKDSSPGSSVEKEDYRPPDTVISYRNNGTAPEGPIREGGGLSSLRRIVESEGAKMETEYQPEFCLRIRIPCRQ